MIPSANSPCPCGSRKKYKRCCRSKDQGRQNLHQRILAGEVPFFVRTSSTEGTSSQLTVSDVSVTRDGVETVLVDKEITVATNSVGGDKTERAAASMSIPVDGISLGSIQVSGNATVSNGNALATLALHAGRDKIKCVSSTGLFAIARVRTQSDTGQQYFDLLFGTSGQTENLDSNGIKQRPHIAIHPDGNGKFIRLAGHCCDLESEMTYSPVTRQVVPQVVRIRSTTHREVLVVNFSRNPSGEIVLDGISFEDAT